MVTILPPEPGEPRRPHGPRDPGDAWVEAPDGQRYWGPGNHLSNTWPPFFFGPLFFVLWILFGSFIILNMVIGVVLDAYNRIKSEGSGTAFMTTGQAEWVATQRSIIAQRPLKAANAPAQEWRMGAFNLVTGTYFDLFIMGVIIANVLLMASAHWNPSEGFATAYSRSMAVFSYIYYCEAVLKITALGLNYFRDNWCRFDFFLVCTTLMDQFGHELLVACGAMRASSTAEDGSNRRRLSQKVKIFISSSMEGVGGVDGGADARGADVEGALGADRTRTVPSRPCVSDGLVR